MNIIATEPFVKSAKSMAKKYRSFNKDYQDFLKELTLNPDLGADLGGGFRKVRMAISSKGKGKSGGARVITFNLIQKNDCLYLIYAYDKSDYDSVAMEVIRQIVEEMGI
ncbi:MAG: type II toxin-antitoxin system RelE/ParE family toxin [Muribaculaceae bacterium]|nr:type II toxin-antitoxin system RelE/ParE family toxin [Muribaculaceae bacterium]